MFNLTSYELTLILHKIVLSLCASKIPKIFGNKLALNQQGNATNHQRIMFRILFFYERYLNRMQ